MVIFSFIIWGIFVLFISWILGINLVNKVLPVKWDHLEEDPLVILLVGFISLIFLWLVLKVFH